MKSIQRRLSLGLASVLIVVGLILAQSSLWLFDHSLRRYLQEDLKDETQTLLVALVRGQNGVQLDERRLDPTFQRPFSGHYFRIDFADETWRSRSLWDRDLPKPAHAGLQDGLGDGPRGQLLLVYRGAIGGRIPLFLSSASAVAALTAIAHERQARQLIDLGAGIGSVVAPLATENPALHLRGIENAPASWLLGYLRTRGLKNCTWTWGSLWQAQLHEADLVYAFLSPEPMPTLWQKAKAEMRPGSLFVSNSFPVPDVEATLIIELEGPGNACLYCYEI